MKAFDLKRYLERRRRMVDSALEAALPAEEGPSSRVMEAMRYSVLAGGKRIRPILLLAGAEAAGGDPAALLPFACALEMVHTYSLIHDDLPAMDDDDLRRGRPTCHKVYGEAVAILAGDGLLTYAFETLTDPGAVSLAEPSLLNRAIFLLARASGIFGMVGGQTADVLMEGQPVTPQTLFFIHSRKTGALIQASVEIGGILGGAGTEQLTRLRKYGEALGLAFQIRDDLLNVEGDPDRIGKPVGSDVQRKKATYPGLFGMDGTKRRARELLRVALQALEPFDEKADPLRSIACYSVERTT